MEQKEQEKQMKYPQEGCLTIASMWTFIVVVFVLICVYCLSSCVTKTKIEYVDRDVNHYITQVQHDTLREKTTDSVYLEIMQKGDTIFQTKYKEVTKWRDRIQEKHDTCFRDSVVVEYKETVKEVTKIPKFYRFAMWFSIIIIIFAIIKLLRWLKIIH